MTVTHTTDTPEYRGLLWDVLCDPADDAARLVLADWLDDCGEGDRAEFIRAGIHRGRESSFVGRHDSLGWFPGTHIDAEFGITRGFISSVTLALADFTVETAKRLFSEHPITSVTLRDQAPAGNPSKCTWFNRNRPHGVIVDTADEIPGWIFKHLKYGLFDQPERRWADYKSTELAQADLCFAAVSCSRNLVGLPALPEITTP